MKTNEEILIIALGLTLFLFFFGTHIAAWRVRFPLRPILMLVIIASVVAIVWLAAAFFTSLDFFTTLRITILYIAMVCAYFQTYPAIGGDSPTISLIAFLGEKQAEGIGKEELEHFLEKNPFVQARLDTLLNSNLVREIDGKYKIIGKGSVAFRLILSFRKLYGPISQGG